jgi:predicted GTPase
MRTTASSYVAQLDAMKKQADEWRKANPDREAKIQFNLPPKVCVIGTISDAVKHGIVSVNPAGLELLQAMAPWGVPSEPTVLMCRVVLELDL